MPPGNTTTESALFGGEMEESFRYPTADAVPWRCVHLFAHLFREDMRATLSSMDQDRWTIVNSLKQPTCKRSVLVQALHSYLKRWLTLMHMIEHQRSSVLLTECPTIAWKGSPSWCEEGAARWVLSDCLRYETIMVGYTLASVHFNYGITLHAKLSPTDLDKKKLQEAGQCYQNAHMILRDVCLRQIKAWIYLAPNIMVEMEEGLAKFMMVLCECKLQELALLTATTAPVSPSTSASLHLWLAGRWDDANLLLMETSIRKTSPWFTWTRYYSYYYRALCYMDCIAAAERDPEASAAAVKVHFLREAQRELSAMKTGGDRWRLAAAAASLRRSVAERLAKETDVRGYTGLLFVAAAAPPPAPVDWRRYMPEKARFYKNDGIVSGLYTIEDECQVFVKNWRA